MSDDAARIRELEERLAEFSAALGRERADREKASRERDEYRKLYELVLFELERAKRYLRAQNKSEKARRSTPITCSSRFARSPT